MLTNTTFALDATEESPVYSPSVDMRKAMFGGRIRSNDLVLASK